MPLKNWYVKTYQVFKNINHKLVNSHYLDYDRGFHQCYERNGDYYIPWYQIDLYAAAQVRILKTVLARDELWIRYEYRKVIPGDDSTQSLGEPVELTAIMRPDGADGAYRLYQIRSPESADAEIFG